MAIDEGQLHHFPLVVGELGQGSRHTFRVE
jgi:hypothetical protein